MLFWRNEKENFIFPGIKQNMLKNISICGGIRTHAYKETYALN